MALVERATLYLGGFLLMGMMVLIAVDVLARTVLKISIPFVPDTVARYLMVGLSFLPIAMAEVMRSHIEATVFVSRLRRRVQDWIVYCGLVLSCGVYAFLTWRTTVAALQSTAKGSYVEVGATTLATWPSYWLLPLAFGAMVLVLVLRLLAGPHQVPQD